MIKIFAFNWQIRKGIMLSQPKSIDFFFAMLVFLNHYNRLLLHVPLKVPIHYANWTFLSFESFICSWHKVTKLFLSSFKLFFVNKNLWITFKPKENSQLEWSSEMVKGMVKWSQKNSAK